MPKFAICDDITGAILRTGWATEPDMQLQAGDGEFAVRLADDAQMDDTSHYWRDGVGWAEYGPQPTPHHVFDHLAHVWTDPRSPTEADAQAARDLVACRSAAVAQVNAAAAEVRARYITVMPGQEMIYLAKEAEALRYLSDLPETLDGYPMLAAEVGLTAPDAHALAQIWANMADLWRDIAARIEAARLGAIYRIEAAQTPAAVSSALEAGLQNFRPEANAASSKS